jgi:hypothetical protein
MTNDKRCPNCGKLIPGISFGGHYDYLDNRYSCKKTMTNDELRVVLAKWAGWRKDYECVDFNEQPVLAWRTPEGKGGFDDSYLPNYPESLNAVATLEAKLTDKEYANYLAHLHCIVHDLKDKWYDTVRGSVLNFEQIRPLLSTTPEQRCRALVATLNLETK